VLLFSGGAALARLGRGNGVRLGAGFASLCSSLHQSVRAGNGQKWRITLADMDNVERLPWH
jgi:hypothetical protein